MQRTVYLGGSITRDPRCVQWRRTATDFLVGRGISVLDPCRGKNWDQISVDGLGTFGTPYDGGGFVARDLRDIDNSEVLLLHWWGDPGRQSIGTWFELGYAYSLAKVVVVSDATGGGILVHPFVYKTMTKGYEDLNDALEYINWLLDGSPSN